MMYKAVKIGLKGQREALADGKVAYCLACGGTQFVVFRYGAFDWLHLQCVSCNAVYCNHGGQCAGLTTFSIEEEQAATDNASHFPVGEVDHQ